MAEVEETETDSYGENWTRYALEHYFISSLNADLYRMVYLLTDNCVVEPLAALLYRWAKVCGLTTSHCSLNPILLFVQADSPVLGSQARTTAVQLLLTVIPHSIMTKISGGTVAHLRYACTCRFTWCYKKSCPCPGNRCSVQYLWPSWPLCRCL